ncbi:MAG: CoB--CoM heterodisulfide reductase subunit B [Candidatus Heimdallarchaeota archaeon]|nr:CoB--CoM heterodisulfide reductase subunit B [Candidatus Heimdallarchaeota archaeon]MCK5048275.1 CoB--CoM heterodisulfide reductase subunit B [Candidatus Heimdallarchaeota archaeon]
MTKPNLLFTGCLIEVNYPYLEKLANDLLPKIGLGISDRIEFMCCPEPISFRGATDYSWLVLAARNLCLAEQKGANIISLCNGCENTLAQANIMLQNDPELLEKVNRDLAEIGFNYKGTVKTRHFLQAIYEEVGLEKLKSFVTRPLSFLKGASHAGCHLLNPADILKFDDPLDPVVLDELMDALGIEVIDYEGKTLCCGVSLATADDREGSINALKTKLLATQKYDADCLIVGCPFCFKQYDVGQRLNRKRLDEVEPTPVYYYLQLLGLAMGLPFEETSISTHKIKSQAHMALFKGEEA